MTEETIKKITEVTNTIKTYIAKDGKKFSNENECIAYESELDLNHYAKKYKMKFISVPTFICNDDHVHGVSFCFPQDGDIKEVTKLLSIYQNYEINKSDEKWEIDCARDLRNVRDSDLEIKMLFKLNKGETYIFYFCWEEYNDSYDYFYNQIVPKEIAMTKLKKEIKRLEGIFGSEINTVAVGDK